MQLVWQWRQHWQVPGHLNFFHQSLLRWNLNLISPALIFSLNRQSMINGQITCREGHSSWWGRARDWGGKPLQQTLPHAKDLGSSKLKKMVIVLRWTTTQVLLAALMWLELLCLWLFPGCQIDVLKAFALKIWLYFCSRIGNHCIVDSSPEEESCSSASLVVAVTPDGSISTLRKVFKSFFLPSCLMVCQNLQVGGGSFHPSTLISATQMAVSVAEEVNFYISN